MKLYGYTEDNPDRIFELSEITIQAPPRELRILAKFINQCADEMEEHDNWDHEHLRDNFIDIDGEVDIVVFSPLSNRQDP